MLKLTLLLTATFLVGSVTSFAQSAEYLVFHDTRATSSAPDQYAREVRFDFKLRSVLGVPGAGGFSGLMTIAPWADISGDNVHQLNFNNGGIFWRQGIQGGAWGGWSQLLTNNGIQSLNGKLVISTPDDDVLTLESTEADSWQYIQFKFPSGRKAYMGVTPGNDFQIKKEGGGNIILDGGNVGIGTITPGNYRLAVEGTIGARKVKVTQTSWADHVFETGYQLPSLYELEKFIQEHKHLPEIPTAKEVLADGQDLGEMNKKLLQKVEELSLYLIEHRKELDALKSEMARLKKQSGL